MSLTIGYARVSLSDGRQDLDAQIASLEAAGCDRIFTDEISGTAGERPGLTEALSHLRAGDRFVVRRLDRLGRSVPVITGLLEEFGSRGVSVVILDFGGGSLDTSSPTGRLLVSVLASVAQLERDLISLRTREALAARARARAHIGRPPSPRETERAVIDLVASGQTVTAAARFAGVSRSTATRILARHRAAEDPKM